jgi:hypothetical protein
LTSANVDVAVTSIRNMGARIDPEKVIRVFIIPRQILISMPFAVLSDVLQRALRDNQDSAALLRRLVDQDLNRAGVRDLPVAYGAGAGDYVALGHAL